MSSETIQRPRAGSKWREPSSFFGDALAISLAGIIALLFVATIDRGPTRIEQLTVANDTPYELFVDVRGPDGSGTGFMPLTIVGPHASIVVNGAIDRGDTWFVRFSGQGQSSGEIALSRDAIRDNGWRLDVPAAVGEQLGARGATTSPQR